MKLFNKNQIATASFLGGPLSIGYLFAQNFKQLNEPEKAKKSIQIGALTTLGIIAFLTFAPSKLTSAIPHVAIPVGYTAMASLYYKQLLEKKVDDSLKNGSKLGSWWKALLVGVIGLILTVVLLLAFGVLYANINSVQYIENYCQSYGKNETINTKLYVPEDAACFVHNVLGSQGYQLNDIDEVLTLAYEYQKQRGMVDESPTKDSIKQMAPVSDYNPVPYILSHQKSKLTAEQISIILDQELEYMKSVGIQVGVEK